jgi:LPS export ABC transporter permease LptF/LPS export ABC transporter permease LptG
MRTLDRYIIRETLLPFVIALLVFTFILLIPYIVELAESMIAKGVPWPMLLTAMATLVPQALGLTIPMSLLISLLVAFGRLSGDREIVVMMACGVSPYRLMRPVAAMALAAWAATSWVMLNAIPDANQRFRELSVKIAQDRAEQEVRPRVFFEDFPNMVLYVRNATGAGAGWEGVLAADTRNPAQPELFVAKRGRMLVDREAQTIQMFLEDGTRHRTNQSDPTFYEVLRFQSTLVSLDPESVFPRIGPAPGDREMTIAQLRERIAEMETKGVSTHNPIMEIHKKFSIPVACFVFALVGLALGVSNRKDGKMASFVLGIGVIFVYYVVMFTAQSMTKGKLMPPWLAMWVPNIVLGLAGAVLLVLRTRSADQPIRITLPPLPRPEWLMRLFTRATSPGPQGAQPVLSASPTASRKGVVLVIRVPQFALPRPRLLDLYVAKLYVRVLGMTAIGMAGLFYIATFIDLSDKVFKGEATMAMVLGYLWWQTPQFLYYILALAVLLSALVTVGLLTKNSELIVMRACGVSLYRMAMPLVAFALAASAVLFGLEERVLATSNRRAEQLKHVIKGGSPQTFDVLNRKWIVGPQGEVFHYIFYNPRDQQLNGLSIFEFDDTRLQLSRRVYASQATFDSTASRTTQQPVWQAQGGWIRNFSAAKGDVAVFQPFNTTSLNIQPPEYFVTEAPEPERMNFGQLRRYIEELRVSGYHLLEHEVALQRKLAFPFVTLVMTLIAVPFAVTTGRRGAMYGIGIGIVLALVYWTMISVFAAFGAAAVITPTLAAWAPKPLFGAAPAYLPMTGRT